MKFAPKVGCWLLVVSTYSTLGNHVYFCYDVELIDMVNYIEDANVIANVPTSISNSEGFLKP